MSADEGVRIICPAHSTVFLDPEQGLCRLPRVPDRQRPTRFYSEFEDKALFYDCFWHHNGSDILLVGPPPVNLLEHHRQARFIAHPSGKELAFEIFPSRSTMTTRLAGAPADTTHVEFSFAGETHEIVIQPSLVNELAGARILFTMNKNNDLCWIYDWARYHVVIHQTDTIVVFDNGSDKYGLNELEKTLGAIPGLKTIVLFSWPYKYGWRDNRVWTLHYWSLFLQVSSMSVVLRRLGLQAEAILNCDIDELVAPVADGNVYGLATCAPHGIATLAGTWVEAVVGPESQVSGSLPGHADFRFVRRDPTRLLSPKKWVLDPKQDWVDGADVFPYMHRIMGAPDRKLTGQHRGSFFHFRGINTGWKETRRNAKPPLSLLHKKSATLEAALARYQMARQQQS